jgi:hypothetical protein
MTLIEVLWMSWAGMILISGALYGYNTMLIGEEEGHSFLPMTLAHPIHHQMSRMQLERRVQHMTPLLESCEVLTAFATLLMIGYYVDWALRTMFV